MGNYYITQILEVLPYLEFIVMGYFLNVQNMEVLDSNRGASRDRLGSHKINIKNTFWNVITSTGP